MGRFCLGFAKCLQCDSEICICDLEMKDIKLWREAEDEVATLVGYDLEPSPLQCIWWTGQGTATTPN